MLSIVVPVYNSQDYLGECIDSLLAQTYTDLEIILVDDGSTDESPAICDGYAAKDARVKVLHKPNEGVQAAVADGVAMSTGAFIGFADSDDIVLPEMYERLMTLAERFGADCAVCGYKRYDQTKGAYIYPGHGLKEGLYEGDGIIKFAKNGVPRLEDAEWLYLLRWNRIFRREKIVPATENCDRSMVFWEDAAVVLPATLACRRIYFTEERLYIYRLNASSITGGKFREKYLDAPWKHLAAVLPYSDILGEKEVYAWAFFNCRTLLRKIVNTRMPLKKKREYILRIMKDGRMRTVLEKIKGVRMTRGAAIWYHIIRCRAALLLIAAKALK